MEKMNIKKLIFTKQNKAKSVCKEFLHTDSNGKRSNGVIIKLKGEYHGKDEYKMELY